ncbi:MAG: hypothetical protein JSS72_13495 [Armatimonadetes bacterium]|nr:hypothetical protein [Armatimonadota bacterium]
MLLPLLTLLATAEKPLVVLPTPLTQLKPLAMAPAAGKNIVATMEDMSFRIIDGTTGHTVRVVGKTPQPAYAIAWSPKGNQIATGDESGRVILWSTDGKKLREYRVHIRGVERLSYSSTGNLLASTGKDDVIDVYDLRTTKPKEAQKIAGAGANFYGGVFRPGTNTILTGTLAEGARLYSFGSPDKKASFSGHQGLGVLDVDSGPNGLMASAGKDNKVILWNPDGSPRATLSGNQDWVCCVRFSPNGQYVATSSTDHFVRVFDIKGNKVAELDQQCSIGSPLCWTPDGTSLLTVAVDDHLQVNKVDPAQGYTAQTGKTKKRRRG